jgi:hypothetical protein
MTQIVNIVRIGERLIVADKDSYNALRAASFPATFIPVAMLESAKTLLGYKSIEFKEQDFEQEFLLPFIKRARASWGAKSEAFTSQFQPGMLIMDAASAGADAARQMAPKIESVMARFFSRWGFKHTFDVSESRGKVRISVEYSSESKTKPVIELEKDAKDLQKFEIEFGGFKLSLSMDDPRGRIESSGNGKDVHIGYVHVDLAIKQGGSFMPYHSGRCTYGEVSSVLPMIAALVQIAEYQPDNYTKLAATND